MTARTAEQPLCRNILLQARRSLRAVVARPSIAVRLNNLNEETYFTKRGDPYGHGGAGYDRPYG
jgi:hypothetical protein